MKLKPITFRAAAAFVNQNHRHNVAPQGQKFSIGLEDDDGTLIGVVTVGRPVGRFNDDGWTAEITRCCVLEGKRNANSKLYGAAFRAATAMGYRKVITYTLQEESGASLKAAGFRLEGQTEAKDGWSVPSRERKELDKYPKGSKNRWVKEANQ